MLEPTVPVGAPEYSFAGYLESLSKDWFADDEDLQTLLRHYGLADEAAWNRLRGHGKFVASSASACADAADRPDALPTLRPFDAFGVPDPVGVEVHHSVKRVLAAALRAGVATEPNVWLRYGLAYLQGQVGESGVVCPLACTDGLVRALKELEGGPETAAALSHILTQAPGGPVHGAQFVTEAQGGSDAATNTMRAVPQPDGSYRMYGRKWFCSNLWAQYWAVTARPDGAPEGPRGVGLFVVPREDPVGTNSGWTADRLKDKLGTRALPTGEIRFHGAVAWPIGSLSSGLSNTVRIVLSTSRFWNALAAGAALRQAERVVHAYAGFREAFGQTISEFPLVAWTMRTLTEERRRYTAASFETLAAWEAAEADGATADEQARHRVLMMLAKTCATRRSTQRIHDAMMVLGGNGIEERFSPLPRLWRDGAILETWEGPHGLLLGRSMLELRKFGAADDPGGWTRLLLGAEATAAVADPLAARLSTILREPDPIAQVLGFRDWAADLYDAMGDLAAIRAGIG